MIYTFQPYDLEGKIDRAYNEHIKLVPRDNDWIALRDADFMMLTPKYEHLIHEMIKKYPQIDLWTCYTNRVNCKKQIIKEMYNEPRMDVHRNKAIELYTTKKYDMKPIARSISGYFMLFKKSTWKKVGGFRGNKFYGIDTNFSNDVLRAGMLIGLMEGLYGMHYYRFNEQGRKLM